MYTVPLGTIVVLVTQTFTFPSSFRMLKLGHSELLRVSESHYAVSVLKNCSLNLMVKSYLVFL